MSVQRGWQCFTVVDNELSAQVVADYLRHNDCPAEVTAKPFPDVQAGVQVLVPGDLLHRARWLWPQSDLSDAELQFFDLRRPPRGRRAALTPRPGPLSATTTPRVECLPLPFRLRYRREL